MTLTTSAALPWLAWSAIAVAWLLLQPRHNVWPLRASDRVWPLLPLLLGGLAWLVPGLMRFDALFAGAFAMASLLLLVWLLSLARRDTSIMDIAYSVAVMVFAAAVWWRLGADTSPRSLLVLGLLGLWGLRCALYLAWRNLPMGEDKRYVRWRQRSGAAWWWWSLFQVFLTQGVMVGLWSLPLVWALSVPGPVGALELAAAALWFVGFVFEAGADAQLARFRADPANHGRVLDSGLWAQCRHPNYFGEAMMWCAWGLFGLAHPWGWLGLACSAYTLHMMNAGSATAMTDAYLLRRKPGYAAYAARTPIFRPRMFGGRPAALPAAAPAPAPAISPPSGPTP
ncbi:MAG: DUF1295 domain-containing protein [Aquabacterium sp.]